MISKALVICSDKNLNGSFMFLLNIFLIYDIISNSIDYIHPQEYLPVDKKENDNAVNYVHRKKP